MKRCAVFLLLLIGFLVLTFPHELVVRRIAARSMPPDVTLAFASVRPSMRPIGYRLTDVVIANDTMRIEIDSLGIGFGLFGGVHFDLIACGGRLVGSLVRSEDGDGKATRDLDVRFDRLNPSTCVDLDGPDLSGTFAGEVTLGGVGRGNGSGAIGTFARSGKFSVTASAGSVSGYFPASRRTKPSGKRAERQPIGQWEFASLAVEGSIEKDRILVSRGRAEAEGVSWESVDASILTGAASPRVQIELRARRVDDSARSKAIMGLLPKAAERDGWRRYRVSGTLSNVQVSGIK
jgi:type II secretion system protein N